jgi:hypothetical protein
VRLVTAAAQRAGFGGGVVVDYPNSKKARKVFLVLFVGDGGAAQVPRGLDGEVDKGAEDRVKFEKRRQREGRREKGKKVKVKERDWILKKKDVSRVGAAWFCVGRFADARCSCIAGEGRRMSRTTRSTPGASGKLHSNSPVMHLVQVSSSFVRLLSGTTRLRRGHGALGVLLLFAARSRLSSKSRH